jgi:phosphoribosylformylglycinamidine synthase subunit PurS
LFISLRSPHSDLARMSIFGFVPRDGLEKELKAGSRSIIFAMSPANFTIEVVVENKPLARDPEGETIHHNLILKGGYSQVTNVRAAKLLRMNVEAGTAEDAQQLVRRLCDDLRIYNPASHICQVRVLS